MPYPSSTGAGRAPRSSSRSSLSRSSPSLRRPSSAGLFATPPGGSAGFAAGLQASGGRWFLAVFLLLLIAFNVAFFLTGGITLEVVKEREGEDMNTSLWTSELEGPPQGQSCEAWLGEADAAQGESARDYRQSPVLVLSEEDPQTIQHCSVGCSFVGKETISPDLVKKSPGTQSFPCDAEVTHGDKEGGASVDRTCMFRVVWEKHPRHTVFLPNDSHAVIMTSSLNSDIPVGHPSWSDFPLLTPTAPKSQDLSVLAVLQDDCHALQPRLDVVRELRRHDLGVQVYGSCVGNSTSDTLMHDTICPFKFVLLFEDYASKDLLSKEFWTSLVCGTIPVVVGTGNLNLFVPADNAFLQVSRAEERATVAQWIKYLMKADDAYESMLRWKDDPLALSDKFLALLDLSVVSPECRLCVHVASQEVMTAEKQLRRPCRCLEESSNTTVYHMFIRERGRFKFLPFFLRSTELTVASLVRTVFSVFKSRNHDTIWKTHRPRHIAGSSTLRAFRIYPVVASQEMALQGTAAFHTDKQLRAFVEAYPCPKLEVILL